MIRIKKSQSDLTAGVFYGMGVSLIHFALLVTIIVVEWPNGKKAEELDKQYEEQISGIDLKT